MIKRKSYKGKLDGVSGIWCDKKPKGLKEVKEIVFYVPDEDKVFTKDGKLFDSVVITEGVDIKDYIEIEKPKEE